MIVSGRGKITSLTSTSTCLTLHLDAYMGQERDSFPRVLPESPAAHGSHTGQRERCARGPRPAGERHRGRPAAAAVERRCADFKGPLAVPPVRERSYFLQQTVDAIGEEANAVTLDIGPGQ